MVSQAPISLINLVGLGDPSGVPLFHFPSCLFDIPGTITSLVLENILLNGSTSTPDAMQLAGPMIDNSQSFFLSFQNVTFLDDEEAVTSVDWPYAFSFMPLLSEFSLRYCTLTGSLPSPFPSFTEHVTIEHTPFTGTIPTPLLPPGSASSPTFVLTDTMVHGDIPPIASNLVAGSRITLYIKSHSLLNGTISSNLLSGPNSATLESISIDFSNNPSLGGSIPSDLWGLPTTNPVASSIFFDLSSTNISSLPTTFIASYNFPELLYLGFYFQASALKGNLPNSIMPASAPKLSDYEFFIFNNPLGGTIPASFISTIASFPTGLVTSPFTTANVDISSSSLTGILMFPSSPPNAPSTLSTRLKLTASSNSLSLIYAQPNASYLTDVRVSNSIGTRGLLDNLFANASSPNAFLSYVDFSNTPFSGTMPDLSLMNTDLLEQLRLTSTAIDFCSDLTRSPWLAQPSLSICDLGATNAYQCASLYPNCTIYAPSPRAAAPATITTVVCYEPSRPGPDFICVQGRWVKVTSYTAPTLVIPPSGTTDPTILNEIFILGNLTSTAVVFKSLGSKVALAGCANNLKSITVELSDEELELIANSTVYRQQLMSVQGSNCTDLSRLSIVTTTTKSNSCTKAGAKPEAKEGQLFGLFSISGTTCRGKSGARVWVIVVPIVCGVVLLAVIITVVVVTCSKSAKDAVRPYAGSDPHPI